MGEGEGGTAWGLEVPSERVQPREGGEDSIIEGLILLYFGFL